MLIDATNSYYGATPFLIRMFFYVSSIFFLFYFIKKTSAIKNWRSYNRRIALTSRPLARYLVNIMAK